jgi:hypothetical protein
LALLVVAFLVVSGYLALRLAGVQEEGIVLEQVSVDTTIDLHTPRPTKDEILNWQVPAEYPRFLSIEAIGLGRTRVESVGRTSTNKIDIPVNIWNAAWYNRSALPGTAGAGVYDCHTFFGSGVKGVCDDLKNLKNGDEIVIERGDGVKYVYKTVEIKNMAVEEANSYMHSLLSVPEGYGASQSITLITCAGNFSMETMTSDRRVTIRAILAR